jgi:hypothetical protein
MKRSHLRVLRSCLGALGWVALFFPAGAPAAEFLKTESRTPYHHVIPLRDAAGEMITLPPEFDDQGKSQEARAVPFSTAQTCGRCHEYNLISQGWHFNATSDNVSPGRPGEPWILTDPATRTQIPISYRGWPGTFKPADLGIADYDFLVAFSRHYPGGGVGEPNRDQINPEDARMRRMLVTGPLEIDCLICHTQDGRYDHEARYKALSVENFKWAPTIASELGVYGAFRAGKAFADSWRPPRPAPTNLPPIKYERRRFDGQNHVTFEVTRRAPVENCYYCHTSSSALSAARWHSDGDVHMRAGMTCVDCHRNSIDHMIVRGYEGEGAHREITEGMVDLRAKMLLRDRPDLVEADARRIAENQIQTEIRKIATLSCRGCHYGVEEADMAGRMGAPYPEHRGLPPIHLEEMSCTACHSGPVPADTMDVVHTSLAHKLGIPAPARGENTAPLIVQPVFLRDTNGIITPNKLVWPSYWGRLQDGQIRPVLPEQIGRIASGKFPTQTTEEVERDPYNTRPLTSAQIQEVLAALAKNSTNSEAVFIASGRMWRMDGTNLVSAEHDAARPYAWPVAHDVRPASQSAGIKGCSDCHGDESPIYFASIEARGPVDPGSAATTTHWAMRGDNGSAAARFAYTFSFRPMFKILVFACALVVLAVLLSHGLACLRGPREGSR